MRGTYGHTWSVAPTTLRNGEHLFLALCTCGCHIETVRKADAVRSMTRHCAAVRKDPGHPTMSLTEASARSATHPDILRRYERAGLVKPLRVDGARLYSVNDLNRIEMCRAFVSGRMGMDTLADIMCLCQLVDTAMGVDAVPERFRGLLGVGA